MNYSDGTLPNSPRATALFQTIFLIVVLFILKNALFKASDADFPWTLLDPVNLIFHEAGHWLFSFFGQFIYVLGGSLMQLLVPSIVLASFWRQGDYYGSGFALFWLGESLHNLSYYIADAQTRALPLITGDPETHDWHYLLNTLHALPLDTAIGHAVAVLGIIAMLVGLAIMLRITWRNFWA